MSVISVLALGCAEDGPDVVRAPGATIQEIAVYQGIKTTIVGGDNAVDIPVVAGREALVRVFATGAGDYNGGPVMGRLTLATPDGESLEFDQPISNLPGQVDEPSLTSTINYWLPADAITADTAFRLELLQDASVAEYD
ncbi:MAG: hypothetical protein KJO07_25300, partial [Deltaproteobacteria bacterium]|nr:hypothetical protein [Deltaproteobacteria bacterium]